jgi:predicted membrane protein
MKKKYLIPLLLVVIWRLIIIKRYNISFWLEASFSVGIILLCLALAYKAHYENQNRNQSMMILGLTLFVTLIILIGFFMN